LYESIHSMVANSSWPRGAPRSVELDELGLVGPVIGGRRLEDLDRALLVGHLLAQRLDLGQLLTRRTGLQTTIDLGLADPTTQRRRRRDPQLLRDLRDLAAPLREPRRSLDDERIGVLPGTTHDTQSPSPGPKATERALHQTRGDSP
jgi:hypothetical protein